VPGADDRPAIPAGEFSFRTSRSGGPGGQNVNKVETRVTLLFDLNGSPSLSEEEKARIRTRLASRVGKDGFLRVVCQKHRSQSANRDEAVARFEALLGRALAREAPRRPTKPSRASRERRLTGKARLSERKRERSRRPSADD
jgi:ribosome-associated protein